MEAKRLEQRPAASISGRPRLVVARDDSWGSGADTLYQLAGRWVGRTLALRSPRFVNELTSSFLHILEISFIASTSIE